MNNYKIAIIPGDGIGKEVMDATLNVLDAIDINFEYIYADAGDECLKKTGTSLPNETIEILKKTDACLFGAVGETVGDVIVKLRQELDLFANIRPIKSYPCSKFQNLDFIIIRENTEGMYIASQEKYTNDGAIARRIITKKAEKRIIDYAFKYAINNNRKKVTGVHKANVLKKTDGLFKEILYETSKNYPEIECEDYFVDATAMYFLTKPESFDVIVTTNLFGDILSDAGAGLIGSLGFAPSGNIGENYGLFEPVHGSAPDIAGQNIANPIAMILSASMMLKYLNENEASKKLENAINETLNNKNILPVDLGGNSTTLEISEAIKSVIK